MSDHEDTSLDTGYSTPVPELDDHTLQSPSVQRARSRRGTANTVHSSVGHHVLNANLDFVNDELLRTRVRDFEEAVVDDEQDGLSPISGRRLGDRSRRGTVTTIDVRSASPPNSVKAFAEARRRERELSDHQAKDFAETRSNRSLQRTISCNSTQTRRTRRYTNSSGRNSIASSSKSVEADVCFPVHNNKSNKNGLNIDFAALEDFIADEEFRSKTPPPNQPQPRIFQDLRTTTQGQQITLDGDFISAGSVDEKDPEQTDGTDTKHHVVDQQEGNRFEYFSSHAENTIHVGEIGDLVLPGEELQTLFTFPEDDEEQDGVWWLNLNNPREEEIKVICKAFGIHPLTREDIFTQETREKIELFPNYYFACFRSFSVEEVSEGRKYNPFNIYVVVFREGTLSFSFSPNSHALQVRKRITGLKDFVAVSSDWICYALIDDIVDSFAPIIGDIERETDVIDDQVFIARTDDLNAFLRKIGMVRKNVMGLMKLLGGKADVLKGFTKRCNTNYEVTPRMDIGLYLGDIQDHVVTMMTNLGHFEKMLSRSHSNYLAQLSIDNITQGNNANRVLSKITVLASILVPLNLICGIFGMNVSVPWKNVDGLAPFFGILGFIAMFVVIALLAAKRVRYL